MVASLLAGLDCRFWAMGFGRLRLPSGVLYSQRLPLCRGRSTGLFGLHLLCVQQNRISANAMATTLSQIVPVPVALLVAPHPQGPFRTGAAFVPAIARNRAMRSSVEGW